MGTERVEIELLGTLRVHTGGSTIGTEAFV
jgi:hypothetical protein